MRPWKPSVWNWEIRTRHMHKQDLSLGDVFNLQKNIFSYMQSHDNNHNVPKHPISQLRRADTSDISGGSKGCTWNMVLISFLGGPELLHVSTAIAHPTQCWHPTINIHPLHSPLRKRFLQKRDMHVIILHSRAQSAIFVESIVICIADFATTMLIFWM